MLPCCHITCSGESRCKNKKAETVSRYDGWVGSGLRGKLFPIVTKTYNTYISYNIWFFIRPEKLDLMSELSRSLTTSKLITVQRKSSLCHQALFWKAKQKSFSSTTEEPRVLWTEAGGVSWALHLAAFMATDQVAVFDMSGVKTWWCVLTHRFFSHHRL